MWMHERGLRVAGMMASILGVAGCGAQPPPASVVVRDSAGIEIVTSSAPQWGAAVPWTVDPMPVVDLARSGEGASHEFVQVTDVRRLADGRILVVDEGLDEVRMYSADGELIRAIGREGDGPGEFRRPQSVQPFRGDSLVVWDFWLRRVTILDGDLEVGRIESIRAPDVRLRQRLFWSGDSTFIGTEYSYGPERERMGFYRQPVEISRVVFESGRRESLATLAGYEGYSFERGDARPPFGKNSVIAVRGSDILAGDADRMEFVVYGPDGSVRQLLRVPDYDLSITAVERRRELAALAPPNAPPFLRALADEMPVPERKPAYSALRIDGAGYLWASRYRSPGSIDEGRTWEIFSPEGTWMGSVATPPRFEVTTIGVDLVAGVLTDSLDVEHPQVLALRSPPTSRDTTSHASLP